MIPVSDNPPRGVVDRRDGSTKGECGVTTTGCLFCKDQIAGSAEYVRNYGEMTWAPKNACQIATCPFWMTRQCWKNTTGRTQDPKLYCPVYRQRQSTGKWPV